MKLSELKHNQSAIIVKVLGTGNFRKRIIEMGFVKGQRIEMVGYAPLNDPIEYRIMGYEVSLRKKEADLIEIVAESEYTKTQLETLTSTEEAVENTARELSKTINIALVGNPNSGKTSLFNLITNSNEHVGNYAGITVDAKHGIYKYNDYTFNIYDLPGTYSLTAYSPEEKYVRNHIEEKKPDLIINIVSASNLERNLYLTTQIIDMDIPCVIALNMYDELQKSDSKFDYESLAKMIGTPIVPTISKKGITENSGIKNLFNTIINVYEGTDETLRHIHINHGGDLQIAINHINKLIKNEANNFQKNIAARFYAIKFIEGDEDAKQFISTLNNSQEIIDYANKKIPHIEKELNEDCESAVINAKYGFIAGALNETFKQGNKIISPITSLLDPIITNKYLGFPIFILFMWLMFQCTFILGAYPQDWIDMAVNAFGGFIADFINDGILKDLIIDGIIGGVGGVLVFLPQILILYFFISLMEDSGYLARAAFIMDKLMHKMGLHGKSFVPMLMGFGCSVPAIMATRTLESRSNRLITMLVVPFMSCSARLPVFVLFAGIFFPKYAALVLLGLYLIGIIVAILSAICFRKFLFKEDDVPFVMELPPYRMPTISATIHHMWERSVQYLKKIGTVILFASIIVWALGYFPLQSENQTNKEHLENSYIGKIGKSMQPVFEPLGFDWKMNVGIIAGLPAKEIVISTLGVLYNDTDNKESLKQSLSNDTYKDGSKVYTPLSTMSYLIFILLYFPCIATIATIKGESGSWKWGVFSMIYTTSVAYVISLLVYQIGSLFN